MKFRFICLSITLNIFLILVSPLKGNKVNTNILVMYSESGSLAFIPFVSMIAKFWKDYLENKPHLDSSWPFYSTVELVDVHSDGDFTETYLLQRLHNRSLSNITAIIGPESYLGEIVGSIASQYNIPCILGGSNPSPVDPTRPSSLRTTFFVEPPAMYQFRELIDVYTANDVKSLVSVSLFDNLDSYNQDTCVGSAELATSRGIKLLSNIYLRSNNSNDDVYDVVKNIRDHLQPDAILWCDWASCLIPDNIETFNPLPLFKRANYLPKMLSMLDCIDQAEVKSLYDDGSFDYVSSGQFVNDKLRGSDYTEDSTPYSSIFRPTTNADDFTVTDQMNIGWTDEFPSSVKLFMEWFQNRTGAVASYQVVSTWAAFDMMESAIYRASQEANNVADGILTAEEVLGMVPQSQATTPFGRVAFNANGVNTLASSIAVQALPSSSTAEIVAPSNLKTASFVYPMPTWDERTYRWRLFRASLEGGLVALASLCSLVLAAIIITVCIHNTDREIRMLNYQHICYMCISAIIICWGLVFLWQSDVTQWQCNSFPWVIYLPASFMVHLTNIKAYRLSLYLYADQTAPPVHFSHRYALALTGCFTLVTVAILAIATAVDPPRRTRFIVDRYRPSLDYHSCATGMAGEALLTLLVVGHVLASLYCVVSVRNGMEAFQDGMIIKEAFVILYAFLLVAFILQRLGLDHATVYLLRTSVLSVGVTLFCFRLLVNRCGKYWIPVLLRESLTAFHVTHIQPRISSLLPKRSVGNVNSDTLHQMSELPLYAREVPNDNSLEEMIRVLNDPVRARTFNSVAKSAVCTESVEFLSAVLAYKREAGELLSGHSCAASDCLRAAADRLYKTYVTAGCDNEVNVPSKMRAAVEKALQGWQDATPLIPLNKAKEALSLDAQKRVDLYDAAFKEISIMLHQNLWNKFRSLETQQLAARDCDGQGNAVLPE